MGTISCLWPFLVCAALFGGGTTETFVQVILVCHTVEMQRTGPNYDEASYNSMGAALLDHSVRLIIVNPFRRTSGFHNCCYGACRPTIKCKLGSGGGDP